MSPRTAGIAGLIPDEPACVEARGMLLTRRGHIVWARPGATALHAPGDRLASIVGSITPSELSAILKILPSDVEVLVREEDFPNDADLSAWHKQIARVYAERKVPAQPGGGRVAVRQLEAGEGYMLDHVPGELRKELLDALTRSPLVAAFCQELPVLFCYAGWETERWWDVSIDTLEGWRNQGYAAAAALRLMAIMRQRGKRAVWTALDSNQPSLRVAARLGFELVGRLVILTRAARSPA